MQLTLSLLMGLMKQLLDIKRLKQMEPELPTQTQMEQG